jgi:putative nucleotidyltransferase with HDIG domain
MTTVGVQRWERRRWLAGGLRAVAFLAPVGLSLGVAALVARALPTPVGLVATASWWAALFVGSGVTLVLFDRLFRRLLPFSVLLNLALVFPGAAPSRFAAAIRGGSVRNLERRIEEAKEHAGSAGVADAAATVVELIGALAAHDPRTRGHCERTRAFSDLIAEELGLGVDDRDRLRWSALLHDIGKLHVEPTLLNKASRPDDDEWRVLQSHPLEGARVVGALGAWLGHWALAIEQHHERFDGGGYPRGLAGDQISLGGRIVAVADAYEVMTAVRAYKRPMTAASAREELVRCAGTHFDPTVVRAFLRVSIGRLPRAAAWVVPLAQLPGVIGVQRVLERSGSAVLSAGAAVTLIAAGLLGPGVVDGLGRGGGDRGATASAASASGPPPAGSAEVVAEALPPPATAPSSGVRGEAVALVPMGRPPGDRVAPGAPRVRPSPDPAPDPEPGPEPPADEGEPSAGDPPAPPPPLASAGARMQTDAPLPEAEAGVRITVDDPTSPPVVEASTHERAFAITLL